MDRPIGALATLYLQQTLKIFCLLSLALKKWWILTHLYVKESNVAQKFIMVAKTVISLEFNYRSSPIAEQNFNLFKKKFKLILVNNEFYNIDEFLEINIETS